MSAAGGKAEMIERRRSASNKENYANALVNYCDGCLKIGAMWQQLNLQSSDDEEEERVVDGRPVDLDRRMADVFASMLERSVDVDTNGSQTRVVNLSSGNDGSQLDDVERGRSAIELTDVRNQWSQDGRNKKIEEKEPSLLDHQMADVFESILKRVLVVDASGFQTRIADVNTGNDERKRKKRRVEENEISLVNLGDEMTDVQVEVSAEPCSSGIGGDGNVGSGWTEEERKRLVDAVKIYGHQDIERLRDAVGTRSAIEVLKYMSSLRESSCGTSELNSTSNGNHETATGSVASQDGKKPKRVSQRSRRKSVHITQPAPEQEKDGCEIMRQIEQHAKQCPDSKLKEWQRVLDYVLSNRKDYSTQIVRRLLHHSAAEENAIARARGLDPWQRNLSFGRIYTHLADSVDGKQRVQLTDKEKMVMQFLIQDLGICARNISSRNATIDYFDNIMTAYQRKSLVLQRTANPDGPPSFAEDALCSLNPFCIPNDLLQMIPEGEMDVVDVAASSSVDTSTATYGGHQSATTSNQIVSMMSLIDRTSQM